VFCFHVVSKPQRASGALIDKFAGGIGEINGRCPRGTRSFPTIICGQITLRVCVELFVSLPHFLGRTIFYG